jgi:hypothetical protein
MTIAAAVLLAGALALFGSKVSAHPTAMGNISGTVVNATHQIAKVAGQKVILQRSDGNSTQDIATTVTGSTGRFVFGDLPADSGDMFAVYAQFQGGLFSSQTVKLGSAAATSLQLTVYDTTNDDAKLRVSVATLLVRQPRAINGLIGVSEVVTIENTGTTAFVGTPTGDASKPMRLLRFATPANASNLSLGIGFDGTQVVTTDKGFGSTATVPPGATDYAFSIDLPYTGTVADVSFKPIYPATRVVVMTPTDMFVEGKDFAAQGLINSLGSSYQVYTLANMAAGNQVALKVTGLPEAGEKHYLDARALTILAAILALLALASLLFYLRRGDIATALGLIPAPAASSDMSVGLQVITPGAIEAGEHAALLKELLALERAHAAGEVTDAEFRQRDRAVRQRLRELIASEQPATLATATGIVAAKTLAPVVTDSHQQDGEAREDATPEQSSGGRR